MVQRASDVDDQDAFEGSPPNDCKPADTERWNKEWLRYLAKEWPIFLRPHTDFPDTPELPRRAIDLFMLECAPGTPLSLYCDREWIRDRNLMELGTGCGGLGKVIARYARSYLGTDFSTVA